MNEPNFSGQYLNEWEKLCKDNPLPIILVTGAAESGKSALVRLILRRNIEEAETGELVAPEIERYGNDQLIIYDSKGYGSSKARQKAWFNEIDSFLTNTGGDPAKAVNIAWHCVSASGPGAQDMDLRMLRLYSERGIPAAAVITGVDGADLDQIKKMMDSILGSLPGQRIFISSTDPEARRQLPASGPQQLFDWSLAHMDAGRQAAFRAACNRDLDGKRARGHSLILKYATAAFAVGWSPIPFSDAPLLLAGQMKLIADLGYLWGLDLQKHVAVGGLLELALSSLGKSAAGGLLKLFPGIGTLAGGMINAAVASSLTYGLGVAINETCRKICQSQLEGRKIPWAEMFSFEHLLDLMRAAMKEYKKHKK